jgi:hypothetical protein
MLYPRISGALHEGGTPLEAKESPVTIRPIPISGIAATLLAAALLAACGTVTKIPVTWRDPAHQRAPYRRIFVIGVAEIDVNRRLFEDRFAAALTGKGAMASPSFGALPRSQRLTEPEIRGAIRGGDYDAVVVTRLLGVEEKTEYVPPRTYTVPEYYYGYYGYYGATWDVVHEPGYYETHRIVRLETNLYDVGTGELVWSGQSETFDPGSLEDGINSVTRAVAERLSEENLIP